MLKDVFESNKNSSVITKNVSLYFSKYIRKMYSDYLTKVAQKKINAEIPTNIDEQMDVEDQDDDRQQTFNQYEMEESKEEKARSMKSGEKYIIRKLISFKINIPKIDDYIQKVTAIEIKNEKVPAYNTNNIENPVMENYYMNSNQSNLANIQANSYGNSYYGNMNQNLNQFKTMQGYNDDSQVPYYAQNFLFQNQNTNHNPFMQYNNNLIS